MPLLSRDLFDLRLDQSEKLVPIYEDEEPLELDEEAYAEKPNLLIEKLKKQAGIGFK